MRLPAYPEQLRQPGVRDSADAGIDEPYARERDQFIFENLTNPSLTLEIKEVAESALVTHIRYKVVKQ